MANLANVGNMAGLYKWTSSDRACNLNLNGENAVSAYSWDLFDLPCFTIWKTTLRRLSCPQRTHKDRQISCTQHTGILLATCRFYYLLKNRPHQSLPPDSSSSWWRAEDRYHHALRPVWVRQDAIRSQECCTDFPALYWWSPPWHFIPFCFAYIDDVLIASPDEATHKQHLQSVLTRLQDYGIQINVDKSEFGVTSLTFLGHTVTPAGIAPLAATKCEAIKQSLFSTSLCFAAWPLQSGQFVLWQCFCDRFCAHLKLFLYKLLVLLKMNWLKLFCWRIHNLWLSVCRTP